MKQGSWKQTHHIKGDGSATFWMGRDLTRTSTLAVKVRLCPCSGSHWQPGDSLMVSQRNCRTQANHLSTGWSEFLQKYLLTDPCCSFSSHSSRPVWFQWQTPGWSDNADNVQIPWTVDKEPHVRTEKMEAPETLWTGDVIKLPGQLPQTCWKC